jgi:uncharacterized membrane protein YidH (DUF202 family)
MPDEAPEPGISDPANRTRLAWSRTAIGFAAIGGAMLKSSPVEGVVVLLLSLPIWATARRAGRVPGAAVRIADLRLVTVTVVLVAVAALAIALFGHHPASLHDLLRLPGRP